MATLDGSFLGSPVHLPHVALCCARQDWCGWKRISNSEEQYWANAAAREAHEAFCATGILTTVSPGLILPRH